MDALRRALAEVDEKLQVCVAQRRALAVRREQLQNQITLCEQVCCDKEARAQVKELIAQEEAAEVAETVVDDEPMPDTVNG